MKSTFALIALLVVAGLTASAPSFAGHSMHGKLKHAKKGHHKGKGKKKKHAADHGAGAGAGAGAGDAGAASGQ